MKIIYLVWPRKDSDLPYGEFKWLNQNKIDKFDLSSIKCKNTSIGYILKFCLVYPNELHEMHNDYSLPPELKIIHNMW